MGGFYDQFYKYNQIYNKWSSNWVTPDESKMSDESLKMDKTLHLNDQYAMSGPRYDFHSINGWIL